MDLEQTCAALHLKSDQLRQEFDELKSWLSVVKENMDLRDKMQSSNGDTLVTMTASEAKSFNEWQNERQFRSEVQQTTARQEQRTSSPIDFKSFIQSSMHTDTNEKVELQSCQPEFPLEVKGPDRLFGEISYQLDMRIMSYVFQGQKRFYGFTVLNIAEKIIEVSTHPLTGKLDEGYRLYLSQRYAELMERLSQLGYKAALHPRFTEFIVNTYSILMSRPGEYSPQEVDYNNPDFLRKLILTSAPEKLQKDLLLVLTCLCSMAKRDGKPLLFW
ncbi:speriolin-like protein [Stegastes partitus]|uniref:Speriolin-like protein n=1 Tax=Stegastes partitus TaxID=144197 RepID=A0A3B4ZQF8_9TELE|nr:PREDICTED: speriolin-like protein [Stegastes partitus]